MRKKALFPLEPSRAAVVSCMALSLSLFSCEINPSSPSLYEVNPPDAPAPTITSITPADSALAGLDTLTIAGQNFSSVVENNLVFLNTSAASLVSATATELKVLTPAVTGDSIYISVAVRGSTKFSNRITYKFLPAAVAVGGFSTSEFATAITRDNAGNLYVALTSGVLDLGIAMFTPEGVRSTYAPLTSGVNRWTSIKFGPQGYLYTARNARVVQRFAPGGGAAAVNWAALPVGNLIVDIDFDANKNLWVGGNNQSIYMFRPNTTSRSFPFIANVRGVRVFNGYLYMAARKDNAEGVWRAQIFPDSLGTPELYYSLDASPSTATNSALSLTFSSDGYLYIGTESPTGVIFVSPDKSGSGSYAAYGSLFVSSTFWLGWGAGDALYASNGVSSPVRLVTRRISAPYHGFE